MSMTECNPAIGRILGAPDTILGHVVSVDQMSQIKEIGRETIMAALTDLAERLHSKNKDVTVIGMDGVVDVLLLKTRETTYDVSFIAISLDDRDIHALRVASGHVAHARRQDVPPGWFNNENQMMLSPLNWQELSRKALVKAEVIFTAPGLTLLSPTWEFATVAKANRAEVCRSRRQPIMLGDMVAMKARGARYHLQDAAAYLHRYLQASGIESVSFETVRSWAKQYQFVLGEDILEDLDREYRRRYGVSGMVVVEASTSRRRFRLRFDGCWIRIVRE